MKPNKCRNWAVAALAAVILCACQSVPSRWNDEVRASIDASMSAPAPGAAAAPAVPENVREAMLPPLEVTIPGGRTAPIDPRFDLAVSNALARQVFMGLVEGTPYDIVLPPDVSGRVTLNLKDVTVPEALAALREAYGYEYRREGNRFFVLGRGLQTRLFQVNHLNLSRRGKSDTRIAASGLTTTGGVGGAGTAGTVAPATSQSGVQVATESTSDFWRQLQQSLTALVGTGEGRTVVVNPQTGIVAVRALPSELRVVEEYLQATHASISRQVILEATVIEVRLNDGFQAGINWAHLGGDVTISQIGGGSVLTGTGEPGRSEIQGNTFNLDPAAGVFDPSVIADASAFGGVFAVAARADDFSAVLELLKAQGEVQVLSSPRVSTVNNQKAVIKVGTDEFFVISQDVTLTGTGANQVLVTTELAPFFSGIALDVTPQIDRDGTINLHIHPSVSEVSAKNITTAVTGSVTQQLTTARSNVQESDSIVRADSGQIVVIGGLMREGSTDEEASVPLLGDIPILGNLFKHRRIARIKRELVILLKPSVIGGADDWHEEVRNAHERLRRIRIGS